MPQAAGAVQHRSDAPALAYVQHSPGATAWAVYEPAEGHRLGVYLGSVQPVDMTGRATTYGKAGTVVAYYVASDPLDRPLYDGNVVARYATRAKAGEALRADSRARGR